MRSKSLKPRIAGKTPLDPHFRIPSTFCPGGTAPPEDPEMLQELPQFAGVTHGMAFGIVVEIGMHVPPLG